MQERQAGHISIARVIESEHPDCDAGQFFPGITPERWEKNDFAIGDEVRFESTPGHTPGHVSVHIASKGSEAVITGDLIHSPQCAERGESQRRGAQYLPRSSRQDARRPARPIRHHGELRPSRHTCTERTPRLLAARGTELGLDVADVEKADFAPDSPGGNAICRMVDAAEIAYVTAFLASDKAWAVSGELIVATGGAGRSVYY